MQTWANLRLLQQRAINSTSSRLIGKIVNEVSSIDSCYTISSFDTAAQRWRKIVRILLLAMRAEHDEMLRRKLQESCSRERRTEWLKLESFFL